MSERRVLQPWELECLKATPESVMADLRADARRGDVHARASAFPKDQKPATTPEPTNRTGWVESPALKPPSGVAMVDRIAGSFAARDRLELIRQLREAADRLAAAEATNAKRDKAP
jgi:hypothetical protein